jgi:hypothetical protein
MPLQQDVQGTRIIKCKNCGCFNIIDLAATHLTCPDCGCENMCYYFGTIAKKFY